MDIERFLAARDAELARLGCKAITEAELLDDANALVTGDYVITPYRCEQAKVVSILGTPYLLQDGQAKEVYILDGHEEGEWWYSLKDDLLHVGRFNSREAAIEQAKTSIEEYRRYMGGNVRTVNVAG